MPRIDINESQQALKDGVQSAIKSVFPIVGQKHTLHLRDIEIVNEKTPHDVGHQKDAKMAGRTFGADVKGQLELVNNETGAVVDARRMKLATLPQITKRYSYIVNGSEVQVDNLWTLKPGIYTRVKQNGELESQINTRGGGFHVGFEPNTRKFKVRIGTANPPLYPVMKALGVDDDTLERTWGKEILDANRIKNHHQHAIDFARRLDPRATVNTFDDASTLIKSRFEASELKPEVTKRTLGSSIDKVTPEAMVLTSKRLLGVARGEERPDDRDALMFKELKSTEDFVGNRITENKRIIERKIGNNLDRREKIGDIVGPDLFNKPIRTFFQKSSLANMTEQTNPLAMVMSHQKTTIMGDEGGVKSAHRIVDEAKLVNPSHFGILDPLHTPEGGKTGVTLHTALGVHKEGSNVTIPVYNMKTGKMERIDSSKIFDSTIAMPDEVDWRQSKPIPKADRVKVSLPGNEIGVMPFKNVDYVMPSNGQAFSLAINMVPFLGNNSQNRATMSGRHQEQAVSLKYREAPLVRSVASKDKTYDDFLGALTTHTSPSDGIVKDVKPGAIRIETKDGVEHNIQIYDNYPLTEKKGVLHSIPVVRLGDEVKKGQLIADNNFTKDGIYAPGVNLKVAYVPLRGHNVEDSIVISESAANKLTSEHMHKKRLSTREAQVMGLSKYRAYYPDRMTVEQRGKLDDQGVIRVGQSVMPGDTLIAALAPRTVEKDDVDLSIIHKSLVKPFKDKALVWEEEHLGTVVAVHNRPKGVEVHIRTEEPAVVGDKIVSRHANKGIIGAVLPDHEMPKTLGGEVIDVVHNPMGVPGRMNVGQVLETAASKVALKTGSPFLVSNFTLPDARSYVESELKRHGLTDKEALIDPKTGREIPPVLVGTQYTLKLHHQVDDKMSARSRDAYDRNLIPKGGGPTGGKAIGALELYGLLAHGAKANIREMSTYKADKAQGGDNDGLWGAIQAGELLPPPRPTFAYTKFTSYLQGLGVNVEKDGNSIIASPMTDQQVLTMSSGEIKDGGKMVKMGTLEPERGGLFDPKVTGGEGGTKWSHIRLNEAMPNPLFEGAAMSVVGIKKPQFERILDGKEAVTSDGKIVLAGTPNAIHGPTAVGHMLDAIDVKTELKKEEERVKNLRGQQLNESNKRIKYLRALDRLEMTPRDAYMSSVIPVLPPQMRPLSVMEDGNIQFDDINHLYKQVALTNQKLGSMHKLTPDEEKHPLRVELYDELRALSGTGGSLNRTYPGILDVIAGTNPKSGFFQDKLIKRRQDMSMRSTIVPDPSLSLDEIGIPRKAAMEVYKPFVVRELRQTFGMSPLEAQKVIQENRDVAIKALKKVVEERPVAVKRDPVLHKFGIQGAKPKIIEGKAIKIHPLVTSGFGADFDGDTMTAFVPISKEAVQEVRDMMPSNILYSPATFKAAYTPIQEMRLGLFGLTETGKTTKRKFNNLAEAEKSVNDGKLGVTDVATINGVKTTVGRLRLNNALPVPMQGGKILTDMDYRFTKKEQENAFNDALKHDPKMYPMVIDKLKDLGNEHAFTSGFSIGLEDLKTHSDVRDPALQMAARKTKNLDLNDPEQAKKFVKTYEDALMKIESGVKEKARGVNTNLDRLEMAAGIKGNAYRQLTAAPVLFTDAGGRVVTSPVTKSYSEGLSVADYWSSMSGGRRGIIQKGQSTAEPGYLSKLMMNATMNKLILDDDCGTTNGISLSTDEPDAIGRYTQAPIKLSDGRTIPAGTVMTPNLMSEVRNSKVSKVIVRSPLKCTHAKGICPKCYGLNEKGQLHDQGTNIGVLAAQSIGERGVQLTLRAFHSGGVHDPSAPTIIQGIDRAKELLNLPETLKGSATLASTNGLVNAVEKDPAGGWNVKIENKRHYVPADRELRVKPGDRVKKGLPITSGSINPHEMLPLTGISPVQNYLADELHKLYAPEGIRRRNTEVVVKAMSDITRVMDPGDHPDFIRGDYASTSMIQNLNKTQLKGQNPIRHEPVLKGVKQIPQDVMEDWLARLNHERLKTTVIEAAQRGWKSNIHGEHPIPGIVYGAEFGTAGPTVY